jgi:hypothetical protein
VTSSSSMISGIDFPGADQPDDLAPRLRQQSRPSTLGHPAPPR